MVSDSRVCNKQQAIKVFLFMVNYEREMRIGTDIRRKRKVEKATEFVERIKKIQEKEKAKY